MQSLRLTRGILNRSVCVAIANSGLSIGTGEASIRIHAIYHLLSHSLSADICRRQSRAIYYRWFNQKQINRIISRVIARCGVYLYRILHFAHFVQMMSDRRASFAPRLFRASIIHITPDLKRVPHKRDVATQHA